MGPHVARRAETVLTLAPPLAALRVLRRDLRGSSSPIVVETADGAYFVKLRGAAQGTAALVAEVIVAALADRIGLGVPARRIVTLDASTPTDDRNDELADLLRASVGENLGFRYLDSARPLRPTDLERIRPDFAAQVRWLDWLVMNPDRSTSNPNILVDGSGFWLIDHGAALPFQHDWASVTEQSPVRDRKTTPHLFDTMDARVADWDPILTTLITREVLGEAAAQVPDSFLVPLLPPVSSSTTLPRRRAAYEAFLWKRLKGPRPFNPSGHAH